MNNFNALNMKQYLVIAWDATDSHAQERRLAVRNEHLAGSRQLKANGNFIMGGAMLNEHENMIGSTMVLQFANDKDFNLWKQNEVYLLKNVWIKIEVHSFKVANI